jgi:hypothetical protein
MCMSNKQGNILKTTSRTACVVTGLSHSSQSGAAVPIERETKRFRRACFPHLLNHMLMSLDTMGKL